MPTRKIVGDGGLDEFLRLTLGYRGNGSVHMDVEAAPLEAVGASISRAGSKRWTCM